jgi:hypothetical protein
MVSKRDRKLMDTTRLKAQLTMVQMATAVPRAHIGKISALMVQGIGPKPGHLNETNKGVVYTAQYLSLYILMK